ncbi:MAG TPA: S41 family peptidase [Candidatus Woesebacteria bacterium]|nr:S41 family peptidase [Candidatus Woesebacteria bacterium]HRT40136.1 S41 family peptidase [Candidatus Woesebacteria bacterium]
MKRFWWGVLIITGVFLGGLLVGRIGLSRKVVQEEVSQNKYVTFLDEVYQIIKENYWNQLTDEQLSNIFILGTEKLTSQSQNVSKKDRENMKKMLEKVLNQYDNDQKRKEFSATLADVVLSNLEPFGRSRLYSQKEEKALSDVVQNKTEEDRYQDLGVTKEAKPEEIAQAYKEQAAKWNPETNKLPEAKEKYEKIQQAYKTLSDPESRKSYDLAGVEPTMDYKLIRPDVFYVHMTKFSPTTFDEMQRVFEKVKGKPGVNSLILDLSDNIGGAIDGLPYFLGPFIGNDQYAYQFLHQGEKQDFKTRTGWLDSLVQYKKVVVLINENTQSTAELMTSVLKKYNVGVVVGRKSKGWGTVERVFPLKTKIDDQETFSVFLVHALSLKEDGLPIEGNGIEPQIYLDNKNWQKELMERFNTSSLVEATSEIISKWR